MDCSGADQTDLTRLIGSRPISNVTGAISSLDRGPALTVQAASVRLPPSTTAFHYRFSIVAGADMGRKVGQHVAQNVLKPAKVADSR